MRSTPSEPERAEARVAKSVAIGVLIAAATAAIGYLSVRRSATLKASARILRPVPGSATAVPQQNQRASALRIPQPQSAAPQPAALPQGTVLSQQAQMIKAAFNAWVDDYAPSMGAALSYYTLFSLAPLLLIVIAVAAMVFGQEAAQGEIVAQLGAIMGADGAMAVEGMLKSARKPAASVLATIVGVALLLLGATAIFAELQDALGVWAAEGKFPMPSLEV